VGTASVHAVRSGRKINVEPPFSSEASLRRALGRLAARSGVPRAAHEAVVTRKLEGGLSLHAITGARAPGGTLLYLERSQRVDSSLDDLVRSGAVSRAMATFFRQCAAARANVLVVGAREARPTAVAAAIVAASKEGHVVALNAGDVIVSSAVSVTHLDAGGAPADTAAMVELVGRLPEARLVVDPFGGAVGALVMDAVATGANGLVAVGSAATLRRGVSRLPADLAAARPGLSVDVAREWVAGTFDLFVEVAQLRDGRRRVVRVAEAAGVLDGEIALRDVFTFVAERTATGGSVEGTFQPTGHTPRIVGDMALRGIHVDSGVFSRPPSR
jgi:pilus assembly protein CpaF